MAFQDITKVLYNGSVKLDYKDKAHKYYVRDRLDFGLPETDPKAWSKVRYPKGTTTLLGETLEKKGLQQWPKNVALRELFGYYGAFKGDNGKEVPAGFSKGVGTLWGDDPSMLMQLNKDQVLEVVESASRGWQRKQKKGADIGSVVHDAIEHYITKQEFDIGEQYMWNIKECEYESEAMRDKALQEFEDDVRQASLAFERFKIWWNLAKPELIAAEELVYSKKHNVSGTFDGLIRLNGKLVLCDWKTSNMHTSAPQGISYDYFIQSAIYAMAWMEMHQTGTKTVKTVNADGSSTYRGEYEPADQKIEDLLIVSARKDGEFDTVFLSDLGLSVGECINWAESVINCYNMMDKTKKALLDHAEPAEETENADTSTT